MRKSLFLFSRDTSLRVPRTLLGTGEGGDAGACAAFAVPFGNSHRPLTRPNRPAHRRSSLRAVTCTLAKETRNAVTRGPPESREGQPKDRTREQGRRNCREIGPRQHGGPTIDRPTDGHDERVEATGRLKDERVRARLTQLLPPSLRSLSSSQATQDDSRPRGNPAPHRRRLPQFRGSEVVRLVCARETEAAASNSRARFRGAVSIFGGTSSNFRSTSLRTAKTGVSRLGPACGRPAADFLDGGPGWPRTAFGQTAATAVRLQTGLAH